jgi:hypothetical protein
MPGTTEEELAQLEAGLAAMRRVLREVEPSAGDLYRLGAEDGSDDLGPALVRAILAAVTCARTGRA